MMLPQPSTGTHLPMMAHPGWRTMPHSDLSFAAFLERCLADGTRHLKLDFKHAAAVEPCLQLLSKRWDVIRANGQVVWLNADILPGPNKRGPPAIPAKEFIPLCRQYCPYAVLSLGWSVGPLGAEERYSLHDMEEMARVCYEHGLPGTCVTFAASMRYAERGLTDVAEILKLVPKSQLLLWTGFGEAPVRPGIFFLVQSKLATLGVSERVGFDVAVAKSCFESSQAEAVDCTFFWSRWARYFCCGQSGADYLLLAHRKPHRTESKEQLMSAEAKPTPLPYESKAVPHAICSPTLSATSSEGSAEVILDDEAEVVLHMERY